MLPPFAIPAPLYAQEQTTPIKIVVLTDMSGAYSALSGRGAVEAAKMAVEEFGGTVLGRPVEVVSVDHRNNAPEAAAKAREAFDAGAELASM